MKKSEIKNITDLEESDTNTVLVFSKYIDPETGRLGITGDGPDDYGNIRHLSGNLFAAWDDGDEEAQIYLGKWVKGEYDE